MIPLIPTMRIVKGCGCLVVLLLVGLLLVVCSLALLVVKAYAAPVDSASVLLVPARPAAPPTTQARGVFLRRHVAVVVPHPACDVRLAGDAAGTQPFAVDDRLALITHLPGGRERRWEHDFRAGGRIAPLAPTSVAALGPDLRDLEVVLEDLEPDTWGNSALWLLPCPNAAALTLTPTRSAAPTLTPTQVAFTITLSTDAPPSASAPGSGTLIWLPGMLLLLAGTGLVLLLRRRRAAALRRAVFSAPVTHILTIYDTETRQQLQELLAHTRLPLGIARRPLRLVPSGAAEAVASLAPAPSQAAQTVLYQTTTATLHVHLDGQRLEARPESRRSSAAI